MKRALIALSALGFIISLVNIFYQCLSQGFFIDEISFVQAATLFFKTGVYQTDLFLTPRIPFAPGISVGLGSSWIAGLVFALGGGLFFARLIHTLFYFFASGVLVFLWLRKIFPHFDKEICLSLVSIFFLVLMHLPYSNGFAMILGEFPGAVWLGWGLFLLPQYSLLGAFCLSVSFWSCKFIYLPFVLLGAGAFLISVRFRLESLTKLVIGAVLPLVIMQVWLFLFHGKEGMNEYWSAFLFLLQTHENGFHFSPSVSGWDRFSSAELEWVRYSLGTKWRILLLSFGMIFPIFIFFFKKKEWLPKGFGALLLFVLSSFGIFFTLCWFFWHQTMFIRHLQPVLFIGGGVWAYGLCQILPDLSKKGFVLGFALLVVVEGALIGKRWLEFSISESYALQCSKEILEQPCYQGPPIEGLKK